MVLRRGSYTVVIINCPVLKIVSVLFVNFHFCDELSFNFKGELFKFDNRNVISDVIGNVNLICIYSVLLLEIVHNLMYNCCIISLISYVMTCHLSAIERYDRKATVGLYVGTR